MRVRVDRNYAMERDESGQVVRLWWLGDSRRRVKTKAEIREQCARIMKRRPLLWVHKIWLRNV